MSARLLLGEGAVIFANDLTIEWRRAIILMRQKYRNICDYDLTSNLLIFWSGRPVHIFPADSPLIVFGGDKNLVIKYDEVSDAGGLIGKIVDSLPKELNQDEVDDLEHLLSLKENLTGKLAVYLRQ